MEDEKYNPSSSESHARELPRSRFTRACASLTKSVQKERRLADHFFHLCTDCSDLACFSLAGLLPLTFANLSDYDKILPDDKLSLLGLNDLAPAKVFWLTLRGTQREYSSKPLKHSIVNPLGPKSDQYQNSPCDKNAFYNRLVMTIKAMIAQDTMS